jgi:hypothetical protein
VFPQARELGDLSDGVALGGLLGLYCPDDADWTEVSCPPSPESSSVNMAEAAKNLRLVAEVCRSCLTYDPLCLTLDDFLYMNR